MVQAKCVLTAFALIGCVFVAHLVDCSKLPEDLDPWQQIAQHNNEHGQLRIFAENGLTSFNHVLNVVQW